ncbi:inorganic phosphate transporter [Ketogulonicigenium vulgare]|uniref:Phosphate transporter n=1 Tax=Ketogulonicigenium vulgare (strain WSH-001) TaxID=759362 RepID=F9Y811_KETVW|nr:inorganic phosphate transporter [Ketogulonicigenium vulgare]ADO42951.1 phosphate transporter family protein [Ketogulonicigenium vulgare Y25]AEM41137.1 Phosphate transport permease protein [Ketogulonicigenium vulgare WSH-001]ALJ81276.1 inorganic phosphate transporter [Ketogulonicigenium vulgare]ANW34014.1 inorganic phosphate transporter [Ketogulonicigenium vulgare]AOZ54859.1 phosphate transporter family protein [Ketogulonicigenium vulgare]
MTDRSSLNQAEGPTHEWAALDRDLNRISRVEDATFYIARPMVGFGLAIVFVALAALWAAIIVGGAPGGVMIIVASVFAAYLALNIGANDVANNMGPAVGANALSMTGALVIAAVCETAGALIAGADVVGTIANGIVAPSSFANSDIFVIAMISALLSSAVWINLATFLGAPVSTTHAIVGGVVGAGIAAAGFGAVDWGGIGRIAASWVVSPVLGGVMAAASLALVHRLVIDRADKIAAARVWVPVLIGIMAWAFGAYLAVKGLKQIVHVSMAGALLIGAALGVISYLASRPYIARKSIGLENRNKSLKVLFQLPLVVSAALMSFAHGANDVSNAIGPLAAIVQTLGLNGADVGSIPLWVMVIGALGISLGLLLFGPKLISMVGDQITKLNAMRAYCVALSAAVTVIAASWLGLPVSSTHIAIGGIFGVGFYREWGEARRMSRGLETEAAPAIANEERRRRRLVRRSHFLTIVAAWIITVPATALLSALGFLALRLLMG